MISPCNAVQRDSGREFPVQGDTNESIISKKGRVI